MGKSVLYTENSPLNPLSNARCNGRAIAVKLFVAIEQRGYAELTYFQSLVVKVAVVFVKARREA